ncbi:hypothetical protein X946_4401 [Burkholderia sp. ABCPW 111]|nr:hypothetical protein X946_4401 [Burkholderia sp. ABCPW 111]
MLSEVTASMISTTNNADVPFCGCHDLDSESLPRIEYTNPAFRKIKISRACGSSMLAIKRAATALNVHFIRTFIDDFVEFPMFCSPLFLTL